MRDTGSLFRIRHRVRGRQALEKRLRAVLIAAHRFGRCRATSRADQQWTARVLDALTSLLERGSEVR